MAGIIFDKRLRVFIPSKALCASACSYMFFGGNERLSEGELGVHQFASSDKTQTANAVKTQAQSQFTVSEIIGFLNEFDTPRFVLERMFEDREMYWFNDEETALLNSDDFTLEPATRAAVSHYLSKALDDAKTEEVEEPAHSTTELIALIQKRLNEIGCSAGAADGIWGARTNAAAVAFAKQSGLPYSKGALISEVFFEALNGAGKDFCPKRELNAITNFAKNYELVCADTSKPLGYRYWKLSHFKSTKLFRLYAHSFVKFDGSYKGRSMKLNLHKKINASPIINSNGYVSQFSFRPGGSDASIAFRGCNKIVASAINSN